MKFLPQRSIKLLTVKSGPILSLEICDIYKIKNTMDGLALMNRNLNNFKAMKHYRIQRETLRENSTSWFSSEACRAAASVSPGNLSEMQSLGPTSVSQGMGTSDLCHNKLCK